MSQAKTPHEALTYRFNYLDMRNHLKSFEESEFPSDMLACERARALFNCEPLEVWQGPRFVCRVEADGEFIEGQILIARQKPN